MRIDKSSVVRQIDDILDKLRESEEEHRKEADDDYGTQTYIDFPEQVTVELCTVLRHAIERFRPPGVAAYSDKVLDALPGPTKEHGSALRSLVGILSALRADYAADRLQSFRELVHADLFADFIEMAEHLLDQGYKDAADVTAGAVLEEHLRKLCALHGVTAGRKLDAMNTELARAGVYSSIDAKDVTAQAGIRNAAAHGEYGKYTAEQVKLMIGSIVGFIGRHPA